MKLTKEQMQEIKKQYLDKGISLFHWMKDNGIDWKGGQIRNFFRQLREEFGEEVFKKVMEGRKFIRINRFVDRFLLQDTLSNEDCDGLIDLFETLKKKVEKAKK